MIERLITIPERNARGALTEVIRMAREDCAAFGSDLDFDSAMWDVTDFAPRPTNKSQTRARIYFTTHEGGSSKSLQGRQPLGEPFGSMIKAMVRLRQDDRPQTVDPLARAVNAARDLNEELADRSFDPCLLLPEDFTAAERRIRRRARPRTAYGLGQALESIAAFIDDHGITPIRLDWHSRIPRQANNRDRTSEIAEAARVDKMPDNDALDALAEIWQVVEDPSDVILMGCVTLLLCAPWRIVELLRIVRDCEVFEDKVDENGVVRNANGDPIQRYGIRYWREKSSKPDIKWIPTVMVEVAKHAVSRIRDATREAHELAVWLNANPGRAWLPGPDLGPQQEFTVREVQGLLGFSKPPAALLWLKERGAETLERMVVRPRFGPRPIKVVRRVELERLLLARLPSIARGPAESPLHQRLFITHANLHHAKRATIPCQLEIVTDQQVRDFISGRREEGRTVVQSAFERLLDRPGLSARTHQFRHLINTLAQEGGLEQGMIARWSGREEIEQNAEYDHLTPVQLAETLREPMAEGMAIGVLADIHTSLPPVDRQTFRETVIATAHVTEIGFCIHDWNSSPCPEFGACSTCASLVFRKGDQKHRAGAVREREDTAWILARLEVEMAEETLGASSHYETTSAKLAALDQIIAMHDDPSIPDGTLVQPNSSSPVHHRDAEEKAA